MSSRLLNLSPELRLSIIFNLSLSDKHRLRLVVCQIFNTLLILEVPLKDLRAAKKKSTIFLVEDALKGQLGFEPPLSVSKHNTYYTTSTTPKFMRSDDEDDYNEEDPEEWEICIDMQQLSLDSRKMLSSESTRIVNSVDYELLRGKLRKASAALLRSRFVCPGKFPFLQSFPDLRTGCGCPMPCPVCIGYSAVSDAKYMQDDEEELKTLWKEIDGMLAKKKGPGAKD
ncbi:hypothetical protein C8R44DRAFT_977928 [Mycena epipterygia]|nr:hypothetical protein C8R44DRAFT_977928 [Mycena epipterygia]